MIKRKHAAEPQDKSQASAHHPAQAQNTQQPAVQFVDNRLESITQERLQEAANRSPQSRRFQAIPEAVDNRSRTPATAPPRPAAANNNTALKQDRARPTIQRKD
jgi:hypothetical protein